MASVGAGPSPSRGARLRAASLPLVVLGAAAAVVVVADPVHHDVPLCPLHAVTGIWCPFCGGLRAVWLLAHLQVGAALSSNLVLFALVPYLALRWWRGVTGRTGPTLRWRGAAVPPRVVGVTVVVALLAYTVVRNLPAGALLAPAG